MNISCYNSIPGCTISYWLSKGLINTFATSKKLNDFGEPKQGLSTADNDLFIREWFEVQLLKINFNSSDSINAFASGQKWFPFNKGGSFRRWYGNQDYVINWENDGRAIKKYERGGRVASVIRNPQYYFFESISWSKIAITNIAFRYYPKGFIFDSAGCSLFSKDQSHEKYIFGLLNSKCCSYILNAMSPTVNFVPGQVSELPIVISDIPVDDIIEQNVQVSKEDWDSFETSWNFKKHPLL